MKFLIAFILIPLTLSSSCLGQNKKRKVKKEIRTDTIDVFKRFEDEFFTEKNVFWSDKDEIGIIFSQRYNNPSTWDEEFMINLTVILPTWDLIEIDRNYSLSEISAECEKVEFMGRGRYNIPTGHIRLISKEKDKLVFSFNIEVLSVNNREFLIYKGMRECRPDH